VTSLSATAAHHRWRRKTADARHPTPTHRVYVRPTPAPGGFAARCAGRASAHIAWWAGETWCKAGARQLLPLWVLGWLALCWTACGCCSMHNR